VTVLFQCLLLGTGSTGNFLLLEESDLVLSDWLIKQSLLFFLQSFDEGLELIFASALVSGNKS